MFKVKIKVIFITDDIAKQGQIPMMYWRAMVIGRRPVELQISTYYAKSGGVGSNPAQKKLFVLSDTKYIDPDAAYWF